MWVCEADVEQHVLAMMADRWAADHVENERGDPGFADMVYSFLGCRGFLEFKFVSTLRHNQKTRIGLTRDQADFLVKHGRISGFCHILLGEATGVGHSYLFGFEVAHTLLKPMKPRDIIALGTRVSDRDHFCEILQRGAL